MAAAAPSGVSSVQSPCLHVVKFQVKVCASRLQGTVQCPLSVSKKSSRLNATTITSRRGARGRRLLSPSTIVRSDAAGDDKVNELRASTGAESTKIWKKENTANNVQSKNPHSYSTELTKQDSFSQLLAKQILSKPCTKQGPCPSNLPVFSSKVREQRNMHVGPRCCSQ